MIRPRTALLLAALAVAAPGLSACSGSSAPDLGTAGQIAPTGQRVAAPDLSGAAVGGGAVTLAGFKGHVVVLNVFGSWCDNCKAEQRGLSSLAGDQAAKGVTFLGLAERDDPGNIATYQRKYQVPYPALDDQSGSLVARFRSLPVSAVPATLVIDKQGREAARFIAGVLPSQLTPVIEALNAEPA